VPTDATFGWFEINLRTHDYGDRLFQTSRGIRKGAWTRLAMPFGEFFGWSFRRFGSLRVKQFEITSVGTRRIGLDDVEITVEPGAAEAVARVPNMLFLPGRDATGAPGGTWSYYRRQKDWAEFACRRLFDLGFNSLAGGDEALEPHRRRTMPYFAGPGLTWAGPRLQDSKGNTALFPDVFDPEWQKGAEEWVRETTDKHRDDPLLLGYFTDNEIQMHQPLSRSIGIMDYFWSPSTAQELVRWLHERYKGEVEALNRRWSSAHHRYQYKRFDDLPADKPTRRGDDDPVGEDLRDFVRHMVKTYADTIVGLYRKHDPNHLVCSNRFAGQFDVGFADLLRPYDLIACNSYPRSRWGQTEFDEGQLQWLRAMHEKTGRPVIVTEWGVSATDTGLPNYWGRLDTQAERAQAYRNVLRQFWSEKYIVGSHWFSWVDSTDAEATNWGIVDANDRPYRPLAGAMREVNADCGQRVREWRR